MKMCSQCWYCTDRHRIGPSVVNSMVGIKLSIFLCFFSRGIPNYDFKIGRITFIRNSRPLVKKVEEVNKVESSPVLHRFRTLELRSKFVASLSFPLIFFYSMLPLKSGSSLEWLELDEATSDILVTDGKRLAWCQFIKPVGWKVTKMVLFYFQEESVFYPD